MLLLIDNYDSFTYNLYHLLKVLYEDIRVFRNDEIKLPELKRFKPIGIIISPGPGKPADAGVSLDCVEYAVETKTPLLGVCLGHQVIGSYFGASVVRAPLPVHGKADKIYHYSSGIFKGLKNPFLATRYHSLVIDRQTIKDPLVITAENSEGLVMGVSHKDLPIHGVQFHPESFLSEEGQKLAMNFLEEVKCYAGN